MRAISLMRWLETKTARPSPASDFSRPRDSGGRLGVQAVDRLVEDQDAGIAEQRGGEAKPLRHAEGKRPGPLPATDASPVRARTSPTR